MTLTSRLTKTDIDKQEFLRRYLPLIRVRLDWAKFMSDATIELYMGLVTAKQVSQFYVPAYVRGGQLDNRPIEDKLTDPHSKLIRFSTAATQPEKWNLLAPTSLTLNRLHRVPIATDVHSGKTLILDSNHTLATRAAVLGTSKPVAVYRVLGVNLQTLLDDFRVLNR